MKSDMQTDCSESGKRPTAAAAAAATKLPHPRKKKAKRKFNSRDVQFEEKATGAVEIAKDPFLLWMRMDSVLQT